MTDAEWPANDFFLNRGHCLRKRYLAPNTRPFEYQWRAVLFMLLREQFPFYGVRGGINGQDMGMGKTLEMLCLIAADKILSRDVGGLDFNDAVAIKKFDSVAAEFLNDETGTETATIVVVDDSGLSVWRECLATHFQSNCLSSRSVETINDACGFSASQYDIIFVKPYVLTRLVENPVGSFLDGRFRRLIVDEAHNARTPGTQISKALCAVDAVRRWVVTGTLITNTEADVATLLLILRMQHPNLQTWQAANMPASPTALYQRGITLEFIGSVLLAIALMRSKASDRHTFYVHEQEPAKLICWMFAIPIDRNLPITVFASHPGRAWELSCLFDVDVTSEEGDVAAAAASITSHHRQRYSGSGALEYYQKLEALERGIANSNAVKRESALLELCRDLGFNNGQLRTLFTSEVADSVNAFAVPITPEMTASRAWVRMLMFSDGSATANVQLGISETVGHLLTQPRSANPALLRQRRERAIAEITALFHKCQRAQSAYTALLGALSDTVVEDSRLGMRSIDTTAPRAAPSHPEGPPGILVFARSSARNSVEWRIQTCLESMLLADHTREARRKPRKPFDVDAVDSDIKSHRNRALPFYTFARQAISHPWALIAGGDKGIEALKRVLASDEPGSATAVHIDLREKIQFVLDYYASVLRCVPVGQDSQAWLERNAHRQLVSTKMQMLREYLLTSLYPDEKALVFCKFKPVMRMLYWFVTEALNMSCQFLSGEDTEAARQQKLGSFTDGPTRVLIVTMDSFSDSLTIVRPNHVIVYETWWSPTEQAQAMDRTHRIGQRRCSFRSVFVLDGSFDLYGLYGVSSTKTFLLRFLSGTQQSCLLDRDETQCVSALRLLAKPGLRFVPLEETAREMMLRNEAAATLTEYNTAKRTRSLQATRTQTLQRADRAKRIFVNLKRMQISLLDQSLSEPTHWRLATEQNTSL